MAYGGVHAWGSRFVLIDDSAAGTRPVTPNLRQSRKSAQKRAAIIRAATEILNAKSYALATMTEIAAALDLRDATLYYYFPSKQALAYACHEQSMATFERLLIAAGQIDGTGAARLKAFLQAMLDDAEANGAQLYFGDYTYLAPVQRALIADWSERLTARLEHFLIAGVADGSIAPCETRLVVNLLLGMLIWLAKWVPSIADLTVERLMNAIGLLCFRGLESDQRI